MQTEFSYKEAMEILKISKASFYNKLDKSKTFLDKHIFTKDGKKCITREGLDIIKNINIEKPSNTVPVEHLEAKIKMLEEHLKEKAQNYTFLQDQLMIKDQQIKTLSQLVENSQILLKQEQYQCKLLAEAVQTTVPEQIFETAEPQKKGLWQRIFRA